MLAILATSLFLVCSCFVNSAVVDLGVVVLFSVVPLIAGIVGFVGFFQREGVNRFSALNIASLFFFNMLMVAYLLYVVVAHV